MNRPHPCRRPRACLLALPLLVALSPVLADTYSVTIQDDIVDADSECSLREAILAANANSFAPECLATPPILTRVGASPPHTILLPAGDYPIQLAGLNEDLGASGDFDLNNSITIQGDGADTTVIHGGGLDRIFDIHSGTVNLNDLSIVNGNPQDSGGGIRALGGALFLSRSVVAHSTALSTVIRAPVGTGLGGGIFTVVSTYISDSEISGNVAGENGAGIYSAGYTRIVNSTISNNFGGYAAVADGPSCLRCRASIGSIQLESSTVRENSGGYSDGELGSVSLSHTIVVGNGEFELDRLRSPALSSGTLLTPIECDGGYSYGYNAFGQDEGCPVEETDLSTTWADFPMGPLFDNGGPTATHALYPGNPAISAGAGLLFARSVPSSCPPTDQRGFERHDGNCDIGAFGVHTDLGVTLTNGIDGAAPGEQVTYSATVRNAYGDPTDAIVLLPLPEQVEDCEASCAPTGAAACVALMEESIDPRIIGAGELMVLGYIFSVRGDDTVEFTTTCSVRDESTPFRLAPSETDLLASAWACAVDWDGSLPGCREPEIPFFPSRLVAPNDETVIDWVPTNDLVFDIDELLPSTSDLSLTLTDPSPGEVVSGTPKTVHVTVENKGPSMAHDTFVEFISSPFAVYWDDTCAGDTRGVFGDGCYLGTLAAGETREFDLTFEIHTWAYPLSLSVITEVSSASLEAAPGDETGSLSFTPLEADNGEFTFEMTGSENPVTDSMLYTITLMNESDSHIAGNASVTTALDPSLSCSWTCSPIYGTRIGLPEMETACSASGSGNLAEDVSVRAGDGLQYSMTCTTDESWDDTFLSSEATFSWYAWELEDDVEMGREVDSVGIHGIFTDGFESGDKTAWDLDVIEE